MKVTMTEAQYRAMQFAMIDAKSMLMLAIEDAKRHEYPTLASFHQSQLDKLCQTMADTAWEKVSLRAD